jgi:glutamyl-tRNA reductase
MAERARVATDAEALVEGEVERFHQRRRTVNVAPAIVALQRQAEELRQTEMRRIQSRLVSLTPEQAAAVEALTRGLVNKFLHPPMQALKQAARENDSTRLDALCETYSLPGSNPDPSNEAGPEPAAEPIANPVQQSNSTTPDASAPERQTSVAGRR